MVASKLGRAFVVSTAVMAMLLVGPEVQAKRTVQTSACPITDLGESTQDGPWGSIARDLQGLTAQGKPILSVFKKKAPQLVRQMKADTTRKNWFPLWGTSINYDEYAKGTIVQPEILSAIGQTMGIKDGVRKTPTDGSAKGELVHAGMEHTYGYLFSTLKTPFGYKRARWVQNNIESGFGLTQGMLSPNTKSGSLFSNVTYLAGQIAFRNEPEKLAILKKGVKGLSKELTGFKTGDLKITRLEETVNLQNLPSGARTVVLRTDLVPFTHSVADSKNTHWLIYSIIDPSQGGARLITAFPVETSFVGVVGKPENLGENKPVITRYNGYVEGLTGKTGVTGTRTLIPAQGATPTASATPSATPSASPSPAQAK